MPEDWTPVTHFEGRALKHVCFSAMEPAIWGTLDALAELKRKGLPEVKE